MTPTELAAIAAKNAGKPLAYVIQTARGRRADARQRAGSTSGEPVTAMIDPKIRAEAEAKHELDDVVLKARSDYDHELIDAGERDRRIAAAREAFAARFPRQEATCA